MFSSGEAARARAFRDLPACSFRPEPPRAGGHGEDGDAERVCKHCKAGTPTDTAASWTRSAFWGGAARCIYNLGDGFQPEDVLSLASGCVVKQYNGEMQEDLRMIQAPMSMLGGEAESEAAAMHSTAARGTSAQLEPV